MAGVPAELHRFVSHYMLPALRVGELQHECHHPISTPICTCIMDLVCHGFLELSSIREDLLTRCHRASYTECSVFHVEAFA